MSNFSPQPVEFKDFSGGETDFYLLGDKKRSEKLTNFLINPDKKPELRPGSAAFDFNLNHLLPGSPTRVGAFLTFNERRELLVQQAQSIYHLRGSWTPITGPEGLSAVPTAGDFSSFSFDEWKGHTYFTTSGGGRPGKLYRTPGGEFQVRTAGLPLPTSQAIYTNNSLLLACLNLANDLRASMVAHINDVGIHDAIDKYSLSYFVDQTWTPLVDDEYPGPVPEPTPAPAATNEASLYELIVALNAAYSHHGREASSASYYHTDITVTIGNSSVRPPKGPFKEPTTSTAPETLEEAATQLNELRQKWNWHRLGVFTHSATNTYATINRYPVTAPALENIGVSAVPYLRNNYTEVIRYANYLKQLYNVHVSKAEVGADFWSPQWSGEQWHVQREISVLPQVCTLPDALNLEDAYLIIYWIWAIYGALHFIDAKTAAHTNTTMDTTAGSADVVDVGGGAVTLPVGGWVIATSSIFTQAFDDPAGKDSRSAKVLSSAAGTATLSKTLVGTVGDQAIQYSLATYHGSYNGLGALETTAVTQVTADETPDPLPGSGLAPNNVDILPSTIGGWLELASTVFLLLTAHVSNRDVHEHGQFPSDFLWGNGPFYKPQLATYSYAFVYKYRYTTEEGVIFQNESEPIFAGTFITAKQFPVGTELATGLPEEDTSVFANLGGFVSTRVAEVASAKVRNLPRLRNTGLTNYDVDNVEVEVYRTQDGGNVYYLLGAVANGTSEFEDVVSDTVSTTREPRLDDREPLYTTGGEVAHEQAPEARYMHIFDNTAYYGYIKDTGQVFKGRIVQSVPGAPDTGPATFSIDLPGELAGISSCRNNVIALCRRGLYRLVGGFNNLGQGSIDKETISDEVGCISSRSIVRTKDGVFFAGTDGFYFTDGFQLIKLSIDRDKTYAARTQTEEQASRIYGAIDPATNRIWWSMQSRPGAIDVDESHIFHMNYGVKPSGVFTSAANGSYWAPTAVAFFGGDMIRGDRRGVLLRHNPKYCSDPKIPSTGAYEDFIGIDQWGTVHIPYLYRSTALDFGSLSVGNYTTKIKLEGDNVGNAAIQVRAIADNNYFPVKNKPAAPIFYRPNPRWGDPTIQWGDDDYKWKYDGSLNMKRRLSHGNLHAQLKQIEFSPARVGVYKYEDYPEDSFVNVDKDTLKVTLQPPYGYDDVQNPLVFPLDVVDMYIAFEEDEYVNEYLITAWAQEELTITDPDGNIYQNFENQKWVIRGYLKESNISLLGFVLETSLFGSRGSPFASPEGGGENGSE